MKIRLLSDFHAEFYEENFGKVIKNLETVTLPPMEGDHQSVLVLAGDICTARRGNMLVKMLDYLSPRFQDIIYIPGNHEAYGSEIMDSAFTIRDICDQFGNVHWKGGRFQVQDKFFNACILWTDFNKNDPLTMFNAGRGMNDYRQIRYGDGRLTPEIVLGMHNHFRQTLEEDIQPGDIVVTHHAPSFRSIHPDYAGAPLNGCYASSLEPLIHAKAPALWMHGHVHYHHDYMIGGTRVVCNPRGYIGERDTGYKNNLVIEVQDAV